MFLLFVQCFFIFVTYFHPFVIFISHFYSLGLWGLQQLHRYINHPFTPYLRASLFLFNGSPTPSGVITRAINLTITIPGFAPKEVVFYLTKLHQLVKLVLGLSWLLLENPLVDWVALTISPRSLQFLTGRSWPEIFSIISKLHSQDPIQVVTTHTPPAVPSHPVMATLSSVDLEPRNFDSTCSLKTPWKTTLPWLPTKILRI